MEEQEEVVEAVCLPVLKKQAPGDACAVKYLPCISAAGEIIVTI